MDKSLRVGLWSSEITELSQSSLQLAPRCFCSTVKESRGVVVPGLPFSWPCPASSSFSASACAVGLLLAPDCHQSHRRVVVLPSGRLSHRDLKLHNSSREFLSLQQCHHQLIVKTKDLHNADGTPKPPSEFLHKSVLAPIDWEYVSIGHDQLFVSPLWLT